VPDAVRRVLRQPWVMPDPTGSGVKTGECDMSAGTCAGHGAEIEDDLTRLGRRSREFEHDVRAALIGGRPRSRRLNGLRPARAVPGVFARWRGSGRARRRP